jgi:murein DD-endopeptidase MepM/ murein hydrolase activator NlpD
MKQAYVIFLTIFIAGCAAAPYRSRDIATISSAGTYHEVRRGETLWSISKIYDIDMQNLAKINRLPDASKIEVGQLIFIPDSEVKEKRADYSRVQTLEKFSWPVKGRVVSYFGSTKDSVKNKGIDIQAPLGSKVLAARSGKVSFVSDHLKGYGKTIIIDHLDGFETVYTYSRENLVRENQAVEKGDAIAVVGTSGRAEEPALHFEIRKKHKPQNPFYYFP